MIVLAVDPGTKRIGLAISDETGTIATPLPAVQVGPHGAHVAGIARLASERRAERIVVGLPLSLDGSEGPSAVAARKLGREIGSATGLPVEFEDERLTTAQAERDMISMGMRRDERKRRIDSAAATLLLQGWLDARSIRRDRGESGSDP